MDLGRLPKLKGLHKRAKRVGRGIGSGKGSHTTGRGQKGQKARTGYNLPVGFEGGQVPLYMKMPKRKGFVSSHRISRFIINLSDLERFSEGKKITPFSLVELNLVKRVPEGGVKVLGSGTLTKKVILEGFTYSKSALEKITKLSGEAK